MSNPYRPVINRSNGYAPQPPPPPAVQAQTQSMVQPYPQSMVQPQPQPMAQPQPQPMAQPQPQPMAQPQFPGTGPSQPSPAVQFSMQQPPPGTRPAGGVYIPPGLPTVNGDDGGNDFVTGAGLQVPGEQSSAKKVVWGPLGEVRYHIRIDGFQKHRSRKDGKLYYFLDGLILSQGNPMYLRAGESLRWVLSERTNARVLESILGGLYMAVSGKGLETFVKKGTQYDDNGVIRIHPGTWNLWVGPEQPLIGLELVIKANKQTAEQSGNVYCKTFFEGVPGHQLVDRESGREQPPTPVGSTWLVPAVTLEQVPPQLQQAYQMELAQQEQQRNRGRAQQGYPPPAQGYPPSAQGYPPPAQGYPPPAQGYPPPAQGYPPPAQGYPPPAQGYPPAAQGYPPAGQGYPPPAQGYPPPAQGYPPPAQGYPPPAQGQPPPGDDVVPF